jgi:hypothetical protein
MCDKSFNWNRKAHLETFRSPLYMGASVTGNLAVSVPGYNTFIAYYFGEVPENMREESDSFWLSTLGIRPEKMGTNPGALVSNLYRDTQTKLLLARTGRAGEIRRGKNIAKKSTDKLKDLGSLQVNSILDVDGEHRGLYEESSIIYGIDLFYWDSIWNICGHGGERKIKETGQRVDVEYQIRRLTQAAKKDGKTLILGTVPHDLEEKVLLKPEKTGWDAPDHDCVNSINQQIKESCKSDNSCYIVDLHSMVDDLYKGEKLALNNGESYSLYELRPDGVHLSKAGSQYVAEEIQRQIEENPPVACQPLD